MIRCANGHENPDGSTYCQTCFVTIDASAQIVQPETKPKTEPEPAVTPVELEQRAQPVGLSVGLEPRTSHGRTAGEHTLTVQNSGTTHLAGEPVLTSADDALSFELEPVTLSVAPGGSASARLRSVPRRSLWIGRARTHPFRVAAGADAAVDGAMVQKARIPAWLATLALVVALIGAGVAAGVVSRDGDEPDVIPTDAGVTISGVVKTKGGRLNVRTAPNGGQIVDRLAQNTDIDIECTIEDEKGRDWYRIGPGRFVFAIHVDAEETPAGC